MQLKIDMQILALEPQPNGLTLIEARAPDGTGLLISVRVAEPLAVGGWMTMALLAEPAPVQPAATAASMRERMQASARGVAAPAALRSAGAGSAGAGSAGAPASAAGDASSMLLSSILGSSAVAGKTANLSEIFDNSPLAERNVDDEMDALLGAPRKG